MLLYRHPTDPARQLLIFLPINPSTAGFSPNPCAGEGVPRRGQERKAWSEGRGGGAKKEREKIGGAGVGGESEKA